MASDLSIDRNVPGMSSGADHDAEILGTGSLSDDIRHQVELEQALLDTQKRLKEREERVEKYETEERHLQEEKVGACECISSRFKGLSSQE